MLRRGEERDADHVVSAGLGGIPLPSTRAVPGQPNSTVAALCYELLKACPGLRRSTNAARSRVCAPAVRRRLTPRRLAESCRDVGPPYHLPRGENPQLGRTRSRPCRVYVARRGTDLRRKFLRREGALHRDHRHPRIWRSCRSQRRHGDGSRRPQLWAIFGRRGYPCRTRATPPSPCRVLRGAIL